MSRRPVEKIVADLVDAVDAARELVARGRGADDADRMLRLAGEAVVGRIGDAAAKLRDQVGDDLSDRYRCSTNSPGSACSKPACFEGRQW